MDLSQKIIRLNQLAAELNHEKSVDTMKSKINTYENIDQYLEWYTDSKILFSEYFDDKNELYKEFKSFDTAGNGFVLMSQFTRQFPIYKRLIEQIKSNSTQTNMIMESKKTNLYKSLKSRRKNNK